MLWNCMLRFLEKMKVANLTDFKVVSRLGSLSHYVQSVRICLTSANSLIARKYDSSNSQMHSPSYLSDPFMVFLTNSSSWTNGSRPFGKKASCKCCGKEGGTSSLQLMMSAFLTALHSLFKYISSQQFGTLLNCRGWVLSKRCL